jgi:hypothetical protein
MTTADAARKTVALEECVSKSPGPADHILIEKGVCETHNYERVRAAGFAFANQESNTQPLYRCYSEAEKAHFASNFCQLGVARLDRPAKLYVFRGLGPKLGRHGFLRLLRFGRNKLNALGT